MEQFFANFPISFSQHDVVSGVEQAQFESKQAVADVNILKKLFSYIDLTSLNSNDSAFSIREFCEKVNNFHQHFPDFPSVAAVCVYPVFSPVLKVSLTAENVRKAVVAGCFPSSQTFTDVKVMEVKKAINFGVNEVDVVISVGEFLDENYEFILEEIRMIKDATKDAHLKVILETGLMTDYQHIWRASLLAMDAGADFIKTSTGKTSVSATPQAAYVMLCAIKAYYKQTGKKVGFKPAGGISLPEDALVYYCLVRNILGEEWLTPDLFRIGASRLANALLTDVASIQAGNEKLISYF